MILYKFHGKKIKLCLCSSFHHMHMNGCMVVGIFRWFCGVLSMQAPRIHLQGFFDKQEPTPLYKFFMSHPELNVSALARRMGISQSLMAQYISGKKKASKTRMNLIFDTIREVGKELEAV